MMETRIFSYRWPIKAIKWFFILAGIIYIVNTIWLIISTIDLANLISGKPDSAFAPIIFFLFVASIVSCLCIFLFDKYPDVDIDNDGVTIKYLFKAIRVSWEEIIKIENRKTPWFTKRKDKFVFTKNFHSWYRASNVFLYGLLQPGFIINSSINDYEALSVSIQNHINANN